MVMIDSTRAVEVVATEHLSNRKHPRGATGLETTGKIRESPSQKLRYEK